MSEPGSDRAQPRPTPSAASLRDLADLARAGSVILQQPLMQVTFEVHHVADRPGYLADRVAPAHGDSEGSVGESNSWTEEPARNPKASFGETLTASAHGLGLVVLTKTGVGVGSRRRYTSVSQTPYESENKDGNRIFRGTARPNPSFLYESAWRYEGLICVDAAAQRIDKWHSDAIRDVIYRIAKVAHECGAPILSLQTPAQVPYSDETLRKITPDREEEMLPDAASLAVRFSIAPQRSSAATVLQISDNLRKFCVERGFGLWLEDTRLGSRTGNWFEISQPNERTTPSQQSSHAGRGMFIKRCIPVTLVGPARVGATDALMSFLGQHIGITACSITFLDDLLFIHLELFFADTPAELLISAGEQADTEATHPGMPYEMLAGMFRAMGRDPLGDPKRTASLMSNTGDYQCLIGPAREIADGDALRRMAIWFSWQTQGVQPDLALPLDGLYGALEDVGLLSKSTSKQHWNTDAPSIDYLVCRNIGNSIFRGKGKLSVVRDSALQSYPTDGLESRPTNLCVAIEEAWRARTARDGRHGVRELTIGWRECWLGHWSMPL
jgi:hypothetical protein